MTSAYIIAASIKNCKGFSAPYGAPELIGIAVTAGLHVWRRNSLLSIGVGTITYMLLVQLVF